MKIENYKDRLPQEDMDYLMFSESKDTMFFVFMGGQSRDTSMAVSHIAGRDYYAVVRTIKSGIKSSHIEEVPKEIIDWVDTQESVGLPATRLHKITGTIARAINQLGNNKDLGANRDALEFAKKLFMIAAAHEEMFAVGVEDSMFLFTYAMNYSDTGGFHVTMHTAPKPEEEEAQK